MRHFNVRKIFEKKKSFLQKLLIISSLFAFFLLRSVDEEVDKSVCLFIHITS